MRLTWHQDKIDKPPGRITDTNDFAAETAP